MHQEECYKGITESWCSLPRSQAESQHKDDKRYKARDPNWISWEVSDYHARACMSFFHNSLTLPPRCDVQEAQQTRITCLQRYSEMVDSESRDESRLMRLCEDLTILHFLTCQPPDRVGVIRRLSLNSDAATLVQHGPDWVIDLTKFRCVLYCNTRLTDCDILVIGTRPPNSTVHPVTTSTPPLSLSIALIATVPAAFPTNHP